MSSYPFVETEFGLLPPRKNFFIPSPFRSEMSIPRPFYGNKKFLEILKEQPSLYEEHLFLYQTAGDSLYKKLLERLESGKIIEERTKKFIGKGKNCEITDKDIQKLYKVTQSDSTFIYNENIRKQFLDIIKNKLNIIIRMNGNLDFNFLQHSFSGNSLKKAFESLVAKTIYMIDDTIKIYCDGKISTDSKVYLGFLASALQVASDMTKQYSYLIPLRGNNDMVCDLEKRYGKDTVYVEYDNLKILSDKNRLLSIQLSPELFKKIEPLVEVFTNKICSLFSVYEDILSSNYYIDINTPERNQFLTEINSLLSEFYKNILVLGEEYVKELLVETTLFEEYDEDRIAVMENINKIIHLIINEYTQHYRIRDRSLIFPSKEENKFYKKIIKKGTMLYRGYKGINPINVNNSYAFFALHPIHLTTYFIPQPKEANKLQEYKNFIKGIATYVLRKDVEVMDFSNISSIRFMKKILEDEGAPEKVVKAFESSWQIIDSEDRFSRYSIEEKDITFIEWLCNKGYGGYIGIDVGEMHDEIAICFSEKSDGIYDSESILDYVGTIDMDKYMNFPLSEEPYRSYPELNLLNIIPMVSFKEFKDKQDMKGEYII